MDIKKMMQQAQDLQQKIQQAQNELSTVEITGSAGGAEYIVSVLVNGKGIAKRVTISDTLMNIDDKTMLEDLIVAAMNDAKRNLDEAVNTKMAGLGIPNELLSN